MTGTWIADASFGHAAITPAALAKVGARGVIAYCGCDDSAKNITKPEFQALIAAGFEVGLVIENQADDAMKGIAEGVRQGRNILAGARALGYDTGNCVLFAGADWNTQPSEYATVDKFQGAFSQMVPVAGFYGNSYAIDYVFAHGHAVVGWQSDSSSFSYGPSAHANLLQRYNDPRAGGLPVDVNDIAHDQLRLMGADMPLTPADVAAVVAAVWAHPFPATGTDGKAVPGTQHTAADWLAGTNMALRDVPTNAELTASEAAALAPILAQLTALQLFGMDPLVLAQAITAHIQLTPKP
jgi:hypothetical protein